MDDSVKKIKKGLLQHLMKIMSDDDDEKLVKIKEMKAPFSGSVSIYEEKEDEEMKPEMPVEEPKSMEQEDEDELDKLYKMRGSKLGK